MPPKILSDDQLRKHDIDTLKRFIRHKLGGYKVAIKDTTADRTLYRGVLCAERPSTIDRISYPPTEAIKKLGRVNRVGKSVFYCSVAAPAVFYELRAKQGDITVYPAMRMHGAADNLAVWPEFVDSSLRIKTVRHVLVEAADEARASYTFLNIGMADIFSDREIVWQEGHVPEVQRRSYIAYEDGAWVMRDGFGRVYHQQN
jgi:hypothetical protein